MQDRRTVTDEGSNMPNFKNFVNNIFFISRAIASAQLEIALIQDNLRRSSDRQQLLGQTASEPRFHFGLIRGPYSFRADHLPKDNAPR